MDGVSPLLTGACSAVQSERLVAHLMSEQNMWTPIGISTVDQSAPYYKIDGYWNGAVWMPHQWFFWKTMFDLGKPELAHRIARTALELWKKDVETTNNCYEHFIVESGRGAGWHQFGGLSTPVMSWFAAYHRPGTVSCGFDVWIREREFNEDHTQFAASLRYFGSIDQSYCVMITMRAACKYTVTWNGKELAYQEPEDGVLAVTLDGNCKDGKLEVRGF